MFVGSINFFFFFLPKNRQFIMMTDSSSFFFFFVFFFDGSLWSPTNILPLLFFQQMTRLKIVATNDNMLLGQRSPICSFLSFGNHSLLHSVDVTIFFSSSLPVYLLASIPFSINSFFLFSFFATTHDDKEDGNEEEKKRET